MDAYQAETRRDAAPGYSRGVTPIGERTMRMTTAACALLLPGLALAYVPDTTSLADVPVLLLPAAEVTEAVDTAKHDPLRYAVAEALDVDVRGGAWDAPEAGIARWRLRVASTGARSLSFHFEHLHLPDGAELRIHAADGRDVQGPLAADADANLWTPLVRSDEAVIEARMPAAAQSIFAITVAQAFHGYRDLTGDAQPKGYFGDSGACEINAACADGDGWRAQIRATVLLTVGNLALCSASLVNNTAQNDRPLVLTANHCGVTGSNVGNTIAYFNVQKSGCTATADGPVNQNIRGKTWLAADAESDFTLFELASAPAAGFNAYYAGWNARSDATPQSGVVVHHPSGDDKKISTYSTRASREDDVCIGGIGIGCIGGMQVDAWTVTWAKGATEGGSSGSGLYNQEKRLVGVLSGGNSACSGAQNNGGVDFFGRLDGAWTAGSASNNQLKVHLDPTGSGCLTLDGKETGAGATGTCGSTSASGDGGSGGGGGAFGESLMVLLLALAALRFHPSLGRLFAAL